MSAKHYTETGIVGNAGRFRHKIGIYSVTATKDSAGFPVETETLVLSVYANVKTTRGMTIIANNSDFEKAYTNFTIRRPKTAINREMIIKFNGKTYTIEYLNDVDEAGVLLEIQAKEVTH